uniref:Uncharacterized protein n=1 Tax=Glycine max TaxID=3847 RepID=A0A0R0KH18_SOYBN
MEENNVTPPALPPLISWCASFSEMPSKRTWSSPRYLGVASIPASHRSSSSTRSNKAGFLRRPTHASFNHKVSTGSLRPWVSNSFDVVDDTFSQWKQPIVQQALSQIVATATSGAYRSLVHACAGYLSSYSPSHARAACVLIDLCSGVLAPWMTQVIAKSSYYGRGSEIWRRTLIHIIITGLPILVQDF